jgi:hypothetical protein
MYMLKPNGPTRVATQASESGDRPLIVLEVGHHVLCMFSSHVLVHEFGVHLSVVNPIAVV